MSLPRMSWQLLASTKTGYMSPGKAETCTRCSKPPEQGGMGGSASSAQEPDCSGAGLGDRGTRCGEGRQRQSALVGVGELGRAAKQRWSRGAGDEEGRGGVGSGTGFPCGAVGLEGKAVPRRGGGGEE